MFELGEQRLGMNFQADRPLFKWYKSTNEESNVKTNKKQQPKLLSNFLSKSFNCTWMNKQVSSLINGKQVCQLSVALKCQVYLHNFCFWLCFRHMNGVLISSPHRKLQTSMNEYQGTDQWIEWATPFRVCWYRTS